MKTKSLLCEYRRGLCAPLIAVHRNDGRRWSHSAHTVLMAAFVVDPTQQDDGWEMPAAYAMDDTLAVSAFQLSSAVHSPQHSGADSGGGASPPAIVPGVGEMQAFGAAVESIRSRIAALETEQSAESQRTAAAIADVKATLTTERTARQNLFQRHVALHKQVNLDRDKAVNATAALRKAGASSYDSLRTRLEKQERATQQAVQQALQAQQAQQLADHRLARVEQFCHALGERLGLPLR